MTSTKALPLGTEITPARLAGPPIGGNSRGGGKRETRWWLSVLAAGLLALAAPAMITADERSAEADVPGAQAAPTYTSDGQPAPTNIVIDDPEMPENAGAQEAIARELLNQQMANAQNAGRVQAPEVGIRGVWITNVGSDVLTSRAKIVEMVDFLKAHNFNVVYPVMWNKAQTLYPSAAMERRFGKKIDPLYGDRDPLAELVIECHRVGIEVVPWFEFGFSVNHTSLGPGGGPLIEAQPNWKAINPDGALLEKNSFEWANAFDPQVQDFLLEMMLEVARKYDIDGLQGDDRLPALPSLGGYDEATLARYKLDTGLDAPRVRDDANPEWQRWTQWRADLLTDFLARWTWRTHAIDPNLVITSSPSIHAWALYEYLQDGPRWLNSGLVDSLHPQCYRRDLEAYKGLIDKLVNEQIKSDRLDRLAPGILIKSGTWVVAPELLIQMVNYNRSKGVNGEVFFFYPGLRADEDALGRALLAGPYNRPARLPYRVPGWRPGGLFSTVENASREGQWDTVETGREFARLADGQTGKASYSVDVPVPANYDIYVKLPADYKDNGPLRLNVRISAQTHADVVLDPKTVTSEGWTWLSMAALPAGRVENIVVQTVPEAGEGQAYSRVTGPVMLLLNRRFSPNVVWNAASVSVAR